jgi:hypothetical protein
VGKGVVDFPDLTKRLTHVEALEEGTHEGGTHEGGLGFMGEKWEEGGKFRGKGKAGRRFGKGVRDFPSEFLGRKNTRYKKSQVESKNTGYKTSCDESFIQVR